MAEAGKYLYCIIPCEQERTFPMSAIGNAGGAVYTICGRGLATVVSNSPEKQYESTRLHMMAHQRVLETVMGEFALLPVRFNTIANSASAIQDIQRLLSKRFNEFQSLLDLVRGKAELGLKVFWRDDKAVFQELVAENAPLKRWRDVLIGKPPEATRLERMHLGELVKAALERKKAKEAAHILRPLRPIAHSCVENLVVADRVVVNAAFLVDRAREQQFDQAVARLDEEVGQRLHLKYIGPVPPCNFVNIVVNWNELA